MPINNSIEGDLVKLAACGMFDVIVHGCNCFNTMKSGIAKAIVDHFPIVAFEDSKTVKGDRNKLGTYSSAYIPQLDLEIINAYTQFTYGTNKVQVEYKAIEKAFAALNEEYKNCGLHIGIPKIGCGLAGGDWPTVEHIIDLVTPDLNITLVEFEAESLISSNDWRDSALYAYRAAYNKQNGVRV